MLFAGRGGVVMGKIGALALRLAVMTLLLFISPALRCAAHADSMSFQMVELGVGQCRAHCPQVIFAQGQIDDGSADALLHFAQQNVSGGELRGIILLDSPGGHVVAAMELGQTIRRLGMAVIVARPGGGSAQNGDLYGGRCYSACVYALMGGRKRVIPPQSKVGVHRMFNYATNFDLSQGGFVQERYVDDGDMRRRLARYTRSMGVDSGLIDLAEQTSPDRLRLLTRAEIARWRLGVQKL